LFGDDSYLPAALTFEAALEMFCVFVFTRGRSFSPAALEGMHGLLGVMPFVSI
jgi:hypothetical protein